MRSHSRAQLIQKRIGIKDKQNDQTEIINKLEFNVDALYQRDLENNLIVGGLPNNIDLNLAITNIMIKLDAQCSMDDVANVSYLRKSNSSNVENNHNKNAPLVLVKFNNYQAKMNLIKKKKEKR